MSEIEKNTKKDRENELDDIDAAFDGLLSDKTGNTGRDPEDQIADVKGTDVPKQTSSRDSTHAVEDVEDETEDRRQEASIQKASDEVIEETEIPVERGIDSNAAVKEETDAYDVKRAKRHVWGEIDIFQEAALMDYSREKTETSKTNRREDVREVLDRKKEKVYEFKVRSLRNAGDYADRSLKEAKEAEKEKTREEIAKDQGVEPVQVILTAAQERHAEATVENDKELLYRLRKEGHEKEIGYEEDAIVGRTGDSLWKNLPKEKRVQKEQALRDAIREEWGGVEDPSGFEAFYRQLSLARETNDQKKIGELQAKLEKRFPGEGQAMMDAFGRSDNLRSSSTIMLQKRMLVVLEQDKENGTNNYDSIKKWLDDESVPPNFKLKKLDELIEQLQRTREEQGLKRDERLDGLKHAENTMEKESIRQAMKEEIAVLEEREQDIELQFAIIDPQLAESRVPEARVPVAKLITDGGFEIANEMMAGGIEKMPDGTIRGKVGGDEWVYIRERENPDAGGGAAHRTLHPGRQRRSDPVSAHPSERSRLRHGPREEGRDRHGFQSARREPDAPRAVHAVGGGCDVHGHVTGGVPPRSRRDPRGRADHSGSHRRHQRDGALQ